MTLNDVIGKVLYIKDENMYCYFAGRNGEYVFFESWIQGDKPEHRTTRTKAWAWENFIEPKDENDLEIQSVTDHPEECLSIQENLIKTLFAGELL